LTFNASTTEAQHTDQNRLEIVPQFNQAQQLMQQHPSNVFPPQQIVSNQFPRIQQQDLAFHITNPQLGVINNRPEAPPPQNTNRINEILKKFGLIMINNPNQDTRVDNGTTQ
ncbi:8392_t:CDS:2, partial [Racocetra fulgida]